MTTAGQLSGTNDLVADLNKDYSVSKEAVRRTRYIKLLNLTEELLSEHSFNKFKLEMLCPKSGCSRGTIYSIFQSKDMLFLHHATKTLALWLNLFDRVNKSDSSVPEKLYAFIYSLEIVRKLYPNGLKCIFIAHSAVSEQCHDDMLFSQLIDYKKEFKHQLNKVIEEGIKSGDISSLLKVKDVTNIIWFSTIGHESMLPVSQHEVALPFIDALITETSSTKTKSVLKKKLNTHFFAHEVHLLNRP